MCSWPQVAVTGSERFTLRLTGNVDRGDKGGEDGQGLSSRVRGVAASHQGQTTHSRQTCTTQTFQSSDFLFPHCTINRTLGILRNKCRKHRISFWKSSHDLSWTSISEHLSLELRVSKRLCLLQIGTNLRTEKGRTERKQVYQERLRKPRYHQSCNELQAATMQQTAPPEPAFTLTCLWTI